MSAPLDTNLHVSSLDIKQELKWFHVVLPHLALVALMALRPNLSAAVRVGAALALIAATVHIILTYELDPRDSYGVGVVVLGMAISGTATLVLLTDPLNEVRYVKDPDPSPLASRPLYKRIWFSACMLYNLRCVGTNLQPTILPPPFRGTRRAWYIRQALYFLYAYMVKDVCETWMELNRHVYPPSLGGPWTHVRPKYEDLHEWQRSLGILGYVGTLYASLILESIGFSVVTVTLGINSPEDCPDMFGDLSEAYTVRRFWAYTWHKLLHRLVRVWGIFVVRALGIPRKTRLSAFVRLHTAFLVSAFQHSLGDLMVGRRYFGRSMPFFLLNGAAITLEDLVLGLLQSLTGITEPTRVTKALGFLWVVLWFRWTLFQWVSWMMETDVLLVPNAISPTKMFILPILHNFSVI